MRIDLLELADSHVQRELAVEDDLPSGRRERVLLTVWVAPADSRTTEYAAVRVAGIALLERALEALRRA